MIAGVDLVFSPATTDYGTRDVAGYCDTCGHFRGLEGEDIGLVGAANDFAAVGRLANANEFRFAGQGSVKTRYNSPGAGSGPNVAYGRNGLLRFNPFTIFQALAARMSTCLISPMSAWPPKRAHRRSRPHDRPAHGLDHGSL